MLLNPRFGCSTVSGKLVIAGQQYDYRTPVRWQRNWSFLTRDRRTFTVGAFLRCPCLFRIPGL
jgi:hypothetical protein